MRSLRKATFPWLVGLGLGSFALAVVPFASASAALLPVCGFVIISAFLYLFNNTVDRTSEWKPGQRIVLFLLLVVDGLLAGYYAVILLLLYLLPALATHQ